MTMITSLLDDNDGGDNDGGNDDDDNDNGVFDDVDVDANVRVDIFTLFLYSIGAFVPIDASVDHWLWCTVLNVIV